MNTNEKKKPTPPPLSQQDQLIEALGLGLAFLLLFASAMKVLFL